AQEGANGADPSPICGDVHVDVAGTGLHGSVHVIQNRHAHLASRIEEGWRGGMRIFGPANVDGATGSAPCVGAALPILLTLENRKHVGEGPTLGPVLRPPVVVPLHTAHPHHGIDAGAATKYVAEGHIEFSIVQSRRRGDGQVVVERAADIVKPYAWVQDGRRVVGSPRFDEQYLPAGRRQFGGKN